MNDSLTPFILFHLPQRRDLKNFSIGVSKIQKLLLKSLLKVTGNRVVFLHENLDKKTVPNKINLQPHDSHPNFDGLKLYAENIGNYLIKNRIVK